MKKQTAPFFFLCSLFFYLFASLNCYAAGETWVYKYSVADKSIRFNDVISVSSGGYLAVGNVWDSSTGDTRQNAVISRLDQNGQVLWSKNFTFPGTWNDDLASVVESSDGGFIAIGSTLLEGPDVYGNTVVVNAVLILKLGANGNTVWRKVIKNKGNSVVSGSRVKATNDGNYVIVGNAIKYHLHDTGVYTPVTVAALIIKIDTDGKELFNRAYYGDWTNSYAWSFNDVVQGSDGSYYVTGFAGFETYSEAVGWGGILVARIAGNGDLVWVRKLDSASEGQGLAIDDSGGRVLLSGGALYVTGITGRTFNLSRYSLSGARSWTKQYSCERLYDTSISATNDFIHSGDGNFYILTGGACTAIAKVNPQGNVLRVNTTSARHQPTSLFLDADKGLVFSSWGGSVIEGTLAHIAKYDSNGNGCENNDDVAFTVSGMEMLNNAVPYVVASLPVSNNEISVFNGPSLGFEQYCSTTPPPPLTKPTGIRASDGTFTDRVRVTFNLVAGATVYRVFRCPDNGNTCGLPVGYPKTGTFDDRKAIPGIVYYYRVRACSPTDCGKFSVANTGFVSAASAAPAVPTGINATDGIYVNRVNLTWNAVNGATTYRIYRCMDNSLNCGSPIGFPRKNIFNDLKGTPEQVYYYRVKACTASDCSDLSAANTGYGAKQLDKPTGIRATDGTYQDRVEVRWNPVTGTAVYRVFRCMDTGQTCGSPVGFPKGTAFNDKKGASGTVYYYRVRACTTEHCSKFSVANTGHRGVISSVERDAERVIVSDVPIPTLSDTGRWILVLMTLGLGLLLMNLKYVRLRE